MLGNCGCGCVDVIFSVVGGEWGVGGVGGGGGGGEGGGGGGGVGGIKTYGRWSVLSAEMGHKGSGDR